MVFNSESWDFTTKYVYGSENLKRLFSYCEKPMQESNSKSILIYISSAPWSDSQVYIEDYKNLLSSLAEQSEKNNEFKYLVSRTDTATDDCDLVGNYGDHPFFSLDWDGCQYEFSNNWFIYASDLNKHMQTPYASLLPQDKLHTVAF